MGQLGEYIFSKAFLRQIVIYIAVIGILVLSTFIWLRFYTNHGESIELPQMIGKSLFEAEQMAMDAGLRVEVIDSVYHELKSPGEVVLQTPTAFYIDGETTEVLPRHVKVNRKIYVTITRKTAPIKKMIGLINKSKRIGLILLEASGLDVGKITYKPSSLGSDIILEQLHDGKRIEEGDPVRIGDKISLVVSESSHKTVSIPNLKGLNLGDAQKKLNDSSLNMGVIVECENCTTSEDTMKVAKVYDQRPGFSEATIRIGGMISLYLTLDSVRFSVKDSLP